ncbi:MAG TPA: hypothetical protein VED46_05270 [Alphaproteobacteria bacterium]|nr:hypothetical protein [Alphaproteobacteria bacterium]
MTRPAFIIHDLEQARAAAAVAEELGQPILLLTPVDMAAALGTLWTQELARHLRRVFPGASILVMFDCGDRAALAHEALRAGAEGVCFTGPADQTEGLAEVAAALGRTFLAHRPAALGLAGISPKRRIAAAKAWISNPEHARNVDSGGFPEKSSKH